VVLPSGRVGVHASTVKTDGMPINEIDEYSGLVNKEASFYYDNSLDKPELENKEQRHRFNYPRRVIKSDLISGTTDSFSKAFSNLLPSNEASNNSEKMGHPTTSMASAIGRYEAISRIIKFELAPPGEKMNVSI
jgi:hypothetical protein